MGEEIAAEPNDTTQFVLKVQAYFKTHGTTLREASNEESLTLVDSSEQLKLFEHCRSDLI